MIKEADPARRSGVICMAFAMVEQSIAVPPKRAFAMPALWAAISAHRWFILALAVVLGLSAWQGARLVLGPAVVVDQVKRGNLVETVVASGHVETPFRVEIGSQITG
jgi:HlyD family secretion protein